MNPNSFIIVVLTEGTDCYSIRVIPRGPGISDAGDANTTRLYRIFILKGTLNSEGKVEGESILHPGEDCRFHLEHWSGKQGWVRTENLTNGYTICQSFNLRLVETKTGKVVYTIITQISVGDAIRANAGDFVTVVTS